MTQAELDLKIPNEIVPFKTKCRLPDGSIAKVCKKSIGNDWLVCNENWWTCSTDWIMLNFIK